MLLIEQCFNLNWGRLISFDFEMFITGLILTVRGTQISNFVPRFFCASSSLSWLALAKVVCLFQYNLLAITLFFGMNIINMQKHLVDPKFFR